MCAVPRPPPAASSRRLFRLGRVFLCEGVKVSSTGKAFEASMPGGTEYIHKVGHIA
jgi:hypothetical protein